MNVFNMINGGGGSGSGLYVWKKYKDSSKSEFIDYVIDDDSTKYPDGGEQGGFYYEKISAIDPSLFNCTKSEIGTFSLTSSSTSITINHSLGVSPSLIIVWTKDDSTSLVTRYGAVCNSSGSQAVAEIHHNGGGYGYGTTGSNSTTSITLSTTKYPYEWGSGMTYHYVIMA